MPRSSTIASHPKRERIERDLLSGVPILKISEQYDIARSALYRHLHRSLAPALKDAMREDAALNVPNLMQRVQNIADDALAARRVLGQQGLHSGATKAAELELKTLDVLMTRLGLDDTETLDLLMQARALAAAVGKLAREQPDAGLRLARLVEDGGASDIAERLRELSTRSAKGLPS